MSKTGLIVGSGRQSEAVINLLSAKQYHLLVFTRSKTSTTSLKLAALANVEIVVNPARQGYDLVVFLAVASRFYFMFVNIDSFKLGE
ncbi:hypothetical protein BGZ61DRAFT_468129 [Ilyonectria robusta]|uniref:uncharacterized protein n=1 Tax=Ilyonectria robusta TaxID=1079257 RepID=UPI001E8ED7B8|nr:uncharacterized protein BGZ61DRAFT_468129 [Ilyonectria robusta]KAH8653291.1 hypothetical protein BGZ61DRAFT_468129 [Ilyonectria robusta]